MRNEFLDAVKKVGVPYHFPAKDSMTYKDVIKVMNYHKPSGIKQRNAERSEKALKQLRQVEADAQLLNKLRKEGSVKRKVHKIEKKTMKLNM